MEEKNFKLKKDQLLNILDSMGACMATDKITIEGLRVGYMHREEPSFVFDSGWRFFSGTEGQEYVDNPSNTMIYDINTIANYDRSIIPYLQMPVGTELFKNKDGCYSS